MPAVTPKDCDFMARTSARWWLRAVGDGFLSRRKGESEIRVDSKRTASWRLKQRRPRKDNYGDSARRAE
jgi:hypothetical protein